MAMALRMHVLPSKDKSRIPLMTESVFCVYAVCGKRLQGAVWSNISVDHPLCRSLKIRVEEARHTRCSST